MDVVAKPMSDAEVREWLPHVTFMTYPAFARDVQRGMTLEQFLGPARAAVILYEIKPRSGHYICVFERPGGSIEVFDSLGYVPDDELDFIPSEFRKRSNQDHSWLLVLLQRSGRRVEYNEVPLQRDEPGVATCGRWCIWRIANRDMPLKRFQALFRGPSGDELVARLIS